MGTTIVTLVAFAIAITCAVQEQIEMTKNKKGE